MGTHWKLKGNIVGSRENSKISSSECLAPTNLKGKNARHLQCVLGPSHWLHEIPPPKRVHRHFWPDLYPSQVQLFFVEFDWPMAKKIETMKAPKN
jgi:hypothetical protein